MTWISALMLVWMATVAHASNCEPAGVRESVNRIIAYELRNDTTDRDEAFFAFFTPRLRAAIVKDISGPDMYVIDFGILCRCQTATLRMEILTITGAKEEAAVKVESWSRGNPPVTQIWHMRRGGKSWQIADLETANDPSLLADLERSNRNR